MKCFIVGVGVVGGNLNRELERLHCELYDKYKDIDTRTEGKNDVTFVCVDTPLVDGQVDVGGVESVIVEHMDVTKVFVIKSTVTVGFTDYLREKYGVHIIFSPEYYGGTQHCNNFDFAFTILGGEKSDCVFVQNVLQNVYDARHKFHIVDAKTAEMVKFMENSWLATKVTFCSEFFRACEKAGIYYEDVRQLFTADPRVSPSHTFVYRDHPFYKSHCLDKDVPSIANQFDMKLLKSVIQINEDVSKLY